MLNNEGPFYHTKTGSSKRIHNMIFFILYFLDKIFDTINCAHRIQAGAKQKVTPIIF